ncbi:MAG TPA: hypothetical protein VFN67_33415 [Polyangiales bacterium]|nr:hypothetical protein [Polyangiales bacterium]
MQRISGASFLCTLALVACAADTEPKAHTKPAANSGEELPRQSEFPDSAVLRAGQVPGLCDHDRGDKVRDLFCSDPPPEVRSLSDLQTLLRTKPDDLGNRMADAYGPNAFVTLLGHSTALSGHRVSALNPRMIVINEGVVMAFQRGVQKAEVIVEARNPGFFNFYLFQFDQACNDKPEGCSPGELFSPSVEQAWQRVALQDDEDLKNTPNDCLQCHQRGQFRQLLMRELNNPWTHFFQPLPTMPGQFLGPGVQGHDLLQDFLDARGDELYGGFDPKKVVGLAPFVLESTVGSDQPVLFDAPGIENERFPYNNGYPDEPGPSPTWQAGYDAFKNGEQLALPYLEARVTDPDKQRERSEAYTRYRNAELDEHELPDFADIFPDDPQVRARIGLQTEPDASAEEALIQACASCHNNVLDQTISRARFNVDLWQLNRAELALAVERLQRKPGTRGVMPPPEARQLDPEVRQRLLDYLENDPLAREPDERLQRAAAMGMSGGKNRRASVRR